MDFFDSLGYTELYTRTSEVLLIGFHLFPYWGPIILGYLFYHQWMHYVQGRFISRINWVLLEIKLPKEIHKTPLAMEIMINALYQSSGKIKWWDKYWKGKVKDWFSLEMASIGGQVKFFIRTGATYKNVIEAQLYAQYTDIEIKPTNVAASDVTEVTLTATKSFGPLDATLAYIYADDNGNGVNNNKAYDTVQAYLTLKF